jgi:glycosyltransferase involved in cell wall biosynthesis
MYLYLLRGLKKEGIRVVFLCINVFEHEDNFLKRLVTKAVLKRVDRMVVHSGQEREEILQFHPQAEVGMHLLPLVDYHQAPPAPPHDDLRLLFFGFVRPYKGLDVLLRALAQLRDRPVTLQIAGEFWKDKEVYLKLVAELGLEERVEVTDGYISEEGMTRFFCEADLVVLPYKQSRTSGIIATAYGFGKPVLATRVGGFHEIVQDGSTGKLVAPDDAEALAQGIRWFLERRSTDFAANIEEFTRSTMTWKTLVDMIEVG